MLASLLSPLLSLRSQLYLGVSVCVGVCAALPALLLFAAATDELGRGGKADVSSQRKTGGLWIDIRD